MTRWISSGARGLAAVSAAGLAMRCGGSVPSADGRAPAAADRPSPSAAHPAAAPLEAGARLASRAIALPGGPPVGMDFLAYDRRAHAVWIPAGNTARVDVLDTTHDAIRSLDGFATAAHEGAHGRRVVGPSSVAIGDGVVFVGNRADAQICPVEPQALARGACVTLGSPPDGIVLIPALHQLWATTPREHAIVVLRVDGLAQPVLDATIALAGEPEGYALDPDAGVLYTNLEDHDRTLGIDVRTHRVVSDWSPGCGTEGPRGLAIDVARRQLFVACTDRVVALDLAHDGRVLGRAATGGGVDLIDYLAERQLLYVGSAATATLRVVHVDARGALRVVASAPTAPGARNAVVDEHGRAYLADSAGGRIFVTEPVP